MMSSIVGMSSRLMRAASGVRRTGMLACGAAAMLIGGAAQPTGAADLYRTIQDDARLSLFAQAALQAGFSEALKGDGPFTLFLPTDKGMKVEGSAFLLQNVLLTPSNAERLADLVRHHVVPDAQADLDTVTQTNLPTLANAPLSVDRHGGTVIVAGRAVVVDCLQADNGVIYVVDRLLWPRD